MIIMIRPWGRSLPLLLLVSAPIMPRAPPTPAVRKEWPDGIDELLVLVWGPVGRRHRREAEPNGDVAAVPVVGVEGGGGAWWWESDRRS